MSNHGGTAFTDPVALNLWRDGLLCAYEYIPALKKNLKVGADFGNKNGHVQGRLDCEIFVQQPRDDLGTDLNRSRDSSEGVSEDSPAASTAEGSGNLHKDKKALLRPSPSRGRKRKTNQWVPIGWSRLSELFQTVQVWAILLITTSLLLLLVQQLLGRKDESTCSTSILLQSMRCVFSTKAVMVGFFCNQSDPVWCNGESDASDDDDSLTAAELAQPYWQGRAGPTFWCHVDARHPNIQKTLANSRWLHPAVSVALRDEKKLISDRMKHLLYEVNCIIIVL